MIAVPNAVVFPLHTAGSCAARAGLGLLITSVISRFWCWGVGAALVSLSRLSAVLFAASGRDPGAGVRAEWGADRSLTRAACQPAGTASAGRLTGAAA